MLEHVQVKRKHTGATSRGPFPSPLWGGVRGGGPGRYTVGVDSHHPPPQPSPNISAFTRVFDALRGEGAHRARCTADHIVSETGPKRHVRSRPPPRSARAGVLPAPHRRRLARAGAAGA